MLPRSRPLQTTNTLAHGVSGASSRESRTTRLAAVPLTILNHLYLAVTGCGSYRSECPRSAWRSRCRAPPRAQSLTALAGTGAPPTANAPAHARHGMRGPSCSLRVRQTTLAPAAVCACFTWNTRKRGALSTATSGLRTRPDEGQLLGCAPLRMAACLVEHNDGSRCCGSYVVPRETDAARGGRSEGHIAKSRIGPTASFLPMRTRAAW